MSKELAENAMNAAVQCLYIAVDKSIADDILGRWISYKIEVKATIQQLEARLAESEKAAYDIDETIQHQKQTIEQLEAKLNDKDTVPRSRYNVCCDQYNEVRDSLTNVRLVAKTEIQRLEARIKELESQRNPHNP